MLGWSRSVTEEPTGMGTGEVAVGAIPLWGVKKGRGVMETQFGETL